MTLLFTIINAKSRLDMKSISSRRSSLITFDDITNSTDTPGFPVPNGYASLNWENVQVLDGLNISNPSAAGYKIGVVSPPYVAFNAYANPMSIRSATTNTFTINSFYSCAAWTDNTTLAMVGARSGTILYTKTVSLFTHNRTFVELNWSNIDNIHFNSSCGFCCDEKHFTMDNLHVTF